MKNGSQQSGAGSRAKNSVGIQNSANRISSSPTVEAKTRGGQRLPLND